MSPVVADHRRVTDLRGLWVPIITPLAPGGEVDWVALDRLARRLLVDGCAGLVALGTTGEPATLDPAERQRVIEACARACAEADRPLMVGVGSNCTRSTIEEAGHVEALVGPAALLVVVPYYTRPSEAAIVAHFRAIADAVATPLVVYNIPHRTGRGLSAGAILELAELPQVIGLKQSVQALDRDTLEILRRRPDHFQVLAGDDAYIAPTVLMGGAGAIAAAAHVCTPMFVALIDAALAGDGRAAAALAHSLLPVIDAGFADPNPAGWKAALHGLGEIRSAALRPPMTSASAETTAAVLGAIAAVDA
ncbi:MAG: 4-hydroxy-tetrahydrodipicolinate synthase [Actinomycetia bacterium]|nr:4-hydroxy-tetrahydrodipicolinate synthase [Actinomycetes bacterium]